MTGGLTGEHPRGLETEGIQITSGVVGRAGKRGRVLEAGEREGKGYWLERVIGWGGLDLPAE